jgi:hypothetical protein
VNTPSLVQSEEIDFLSSLPNIIDADVHNVMYALKVPDDDGYFVFWDEYGEPNLF